MSQVDPEPKLEPLGCIPPALGALRCPALGAAIPVLDDLAGLVDREPRRAHDLALLASGIFDNAPAGLQGVRLARNAPGRHQADLGIVHPARHVFIVGRAGR